MNELNPSSALELRVKQLEAHRRRLMLLLPGILGLPVVVLLLGADVEKDQSATTLTAEKFVLVDTEKKPRASLAIENGTSQLRLIDGNGNVRVRLDAGEGHDTGLYLFNEKNKTFAALKKQKDLGALLYLGTDEEQKVVLLGANKDNGVGYIDFFDGQGNWKAGYGGSAVK
jgi:hypothetical protein